MNQSIFLAVFLIDINNKNCLEAFVKIFSLCMSNSFEAKIGMHIERNTNFKSHSLIFYYLNTCQQKLLLQTIKYFVNYQN
jgi:hypothetical protein